MLSFKYIYDAIHEIEENIEDNEKCHILEDKLREDFIISLAIKEDKTGEMARRILTTNDLNFTRHHV